MYFSRTNPVLPCKQQGLVLLIMAIIIILGGISYIVSEQSVNDARQHRQQVTQRALYQAKQALLGYAMTRSDVIQPSVKPGRYGYLPCPANSNGDGKSMGGGCGSDRRNYLGWFPWRSLDMPPLKDGNGDCLLYVVSSSYKFGAVTELLNEDTFGMLQIVDESGNIIQGATAKDRPVAIVFSAGTALSGQNRHKNTATECGNDPNNFTAYLDSYEVSPGVIINNGEVNAGPDQVDQFVRFISQGDTGEGNDQMLAISREEIWRPIMKRSEFDDSNTGDTNKMRRLTESLAHCLAMYANDNSTHRLPLPAMLDLNGGDYRFNNSYADTMPGSGVSYLGRYPFTTANADSIIPGTVANSVLFEKVFKISGSCSNITLTSPGGGAIADLADASAQERKLWNNWKDHIFYAVSKDYAASKSSVPGSCGNCIKVNGIKYAAAVIYSGQKLAGQIRQAPLANIDIGVVSDTKKIKDNYIEMLNPSTKGTGDFTRTANDIIFCLTDFIPATSTTSATPVNVAACM